LADWSQITNSLTTRTNWDRGKPLTMPIISPGKGDHLYWQYDCTTIAIGANMPEYIFSMRLQDNESTTTGTYYTISLPTPKW